jgi:probable DNA metabolism protein
MMRRYRYDGSFEGYLCAVCRCLADGIESAEFLRDDPSAEPGLFQEPTLDVETDRDCADGFRQRFAATVSTEAFTTLRYAFHSGHGGIERMLWEYVRLALNAGRRLSSMPADKRVNSVDRLARRVAGEAHKYKGFIRFREVEEGFLYARIEPEADIIRFLAPHFVQRVGDRPWMIHDLRRSLAALYDLRTWRLLRDITLSDSPRFTDAEHECSDLWRRYFQRLAIEPRHNPKLQQKHVPLRRRKHMLEFDYS